MKILSFGEILWDVFPFEKKIGGAPFNFAAHCAKLGAESFLISAVGNDENGADALEEAKRLGIKTDYISVSRKYKTGVCNVTLENGIPSYNLVTDVAYDHIPNDYISGEFDAIYMGTLAMRSADSKRSFEKLMQYVKTKEVVFDVNLRGNFYSRDLIVSLLRETTVLKVSDEEIGFFGRLTHIDTCIDLSNRFSKLKYICLTLGGDGAMVYDCKNKKVIYSQKPKGQVVSTVGAGDSFAACFTVCLLKGFSVEECLEKAVNLSDFVVTQLGAVPDYSPEILLGLS